MSHAPIYFQFQDERSAAIAIDTLSELGYHVHPAGEGGKCLQLWVENDDLTSALEIAQAGGGTMLDPDGAQPEPASYEAAYGLDTVPIPAHVVNEDWTETYAVSDPADGLADADDAAFDPSGDDYDHFSAGVRL